MDGASVDQTVSQGDVPPPFAADAAVNEELQAAPEEDNVNDVPPPQQQPWNDEGESAADLPPPTTFYDAEGEEQAASDNDQPKEPSPALNQESYDVSALEETQPAKPVGRVAVAAGTAGSLVARLAARRMQLLAEPVLSAETVATVEDTAAALAELRVLEAAAAAAEAADRGEAPKAKHHRSENQDPEKELESDRTELGKQIKRLLKWAMTAEPWGPAQLTEDIFVALVCSLAVIRGRVAPLANPTEDAAKVEEAASQTYDELFNGSSVMKSDWRNKVDQLLGVAAPPKQTAAPSNNGANVRASTNNNTSNNNNTPAAAAPQADRPPAYTAALNITPAEFGFNAAEVRAIEYAHEPAFRDIVALQLYVFKTNSTVPQASERLKIPMSVVGRRDIFRIPRLLDRFRVDRSFEPVSSVHPSMPKSWDVTCRLIGFARVRYFVGNPREVVTGRVCIITDLRGRPVYTGNTIRRTEREAWDAAYKEVHGSHWFTPSKAQYLVGPPQLKGLPRIMCVATEDNSPQAVQQNTMLARLLRPMADLIDHVETFRILQESHNLDPMTLLGIVRYVAHAHGVVAKHGR